MNTEEYDVYYELQKWDDIWDIDMIIYDDMETATEVLRLARKRCPEYKWRICECKALAL